MSVCVSPKILSSKIFIFPCKSDARRFEGVQDQKGGRKKLIKTVKKYVAVKDVAEGEVITITGPVSGGSQCHLRSCIAPHGGTHNRAGHAKVDFSTVQSNGYWYHRIARDIRPPGNVDIIPAGCRG